MLIMRDYQIQIDSNIVLGYEGENNARMLRIRTTDELADFASIRLLIGTLDCGEVEWRAETSYKLIEKSLGADMLGDAGMKTCQLVMTDTQGDVVMKTNQFFMWVKSSNITDRVYICTEDAIKNALEVLIDEGILVALSIEDGDITTPKIADGAVTEEKLGQDVVGNISLTSEQIAALIALLD